MTRIATGDAKEKIVLTARFLHWGDASKIKVDRVKMASGKDVATALFQAVLPASSLEKLAVAPGGKTAKAQFGLSPDGEYGIPPGVDFHTSLTIGERRRDRHGESCMAQSVCQMTPMPDIVGARFFFAAYGDGEAERKAAALRPQAGASSNLAGATVRDDAAAPQKFVAPTQVATESGGDSRGRGRVRSTRLRTACVCLHRARALSLSLRMRTVHHPTRKERKGIYVLALCGATTSTPSVGQTTPPPLPFLVVVLPHTPKYWCHCHTPAHWCHWASCFVAGASSGGLGRVATWLK